MNTIDGIWELLENLLETIRALIEKIFNSDDDAHWWQLTREILQVVMAIVAIAKFLLAVKKEQVKRGNRA